MRRLAAAIAIVAPMIAVVAHGAQAEESDARIVLSIESLDGVDSEALREAIASELGVEVALEAPGIAGRGTLSVRGEGKSVVVSFGSEGKSVSRTLDRPSKPAVAVEMIALLAGNLVRDEASGLIDELRKKAPAKPSVEVVPSAKPPPPIAVKPVVKTEPPKPSPCAFMPDRWRVGIDLAPGAGMSSVARGRGVRALSIGIAGTLGDGIHGVEVAGGIAVVRQAMCGVQVAGGASVSLGAVRGLQVAGGLNYGGYVSGLQLASVNLSGGEVHGAQIGVVNVAAGEVRGLQLGLVNVARDGDASIGLLSIYRNGRTNLDALATESGGLFASIEHGGRVLHNIYGAGERRTGGNPRFLVAIGIGARIVGNEDLTFDLDLLHQWFIPPRGDFYTSLEQIRALFAVKLSKAFSVVAGPTWSLLVTKDPEEEASSAIPSTSLTKSDASTRVIGWPGITFGVRLL